MIPWLFHLQIRTLSDCYCRLLFPPTNCCGCHCGWHDDKTEDHGHPSVTRKFADYSFVWWWKFRGRSSLLFPCTTEAMLKIPHGRHIGVLSDSQDGASAHPMLMPHVAWPFPCARCLLRTSLHVWSRNPLEAKAGKRQTSGQGRSHARSTGSP